jgi:hypothetical protein
MNTAELIQSISSEGCTLTVDNGKIRGNKQIPNNLMDMLRLNKQSVMEALIMDGKARAAGFTIVLPGEVYTVSLSRKSDLFIERINGRWAVYRATYITGRPAAAYSKTIASGNSFEYVLTKARSYLNFIEKIRNRGNKRQKTPIRQNKTAQNHT